MQGSDIRIGEIKRARLPFGKRAPLLDLAMFPLPFSKMTSSYPQLKKGAWENDQNVLEKPPAPLLLADLIDQSHRRLDLNFAGEDRRLATAFHSHH